MPGRADVETVRDRLYVYGRGTGGGAAGRYRRAAARRRRAYGGALPAGAMLAAALLVVAVADRHDRGMLALGVLLGGLIGGYIALLDSPRGTVGRWRAGHQGERRTARALAPLRGRGYVMLHDIPDRRAGRRERHGNVDHVVVAPGGVFILHSKWLGGEAFVTGDTIHVRMLDDDGALCEWRHVAGAVRGQAARLQADLDRTNVRFVQGVVVFWNTFDAGVVRGDNVVFVHGERLAGWLQEQGAGPGGWRVSEIAARIAELRPHAAPTVGAAARRALPM